MPKYKTIRIKKAGGGTRLQKVQVLASGKYKFVKNSTKSRKTTTRKGMIRKTARRAYEVGTRKRRVVCRTVKRRKRKTNKDSMWSW